MKDRKQKAKAAASSKTENLESLDKSVKTDDEPIDAEHAEAVELDAEAEAGIKIAGTDDRDKRIDELTDKWRRTLAEFDNFRKRTIKEKAGMYDDGAKDALERLLPVIDNFERALCSEADKESGFYKGVDMIAKQLVGYLKDMNVEEIPGVGVEFDPTIHFAVSHAEDENLGQNEVSEVMQKGYRYKDKVIRPAMVKVVN